MAELIGDEKEDQGWRHDLFKCEKVGSFTLKWGRVDFKRGKK